jgi:hypothetical protein
MQSIVALSNRKRQRHRKSLVDIPTHPCIAMRKELKDLATEKRKFKLCKFFEKSTLSLSLSLSLSLPSSSCSMPYLVNFRIPKNPLKIKHVPMVFTENINDQWNKLLRPGHMARVCTYHDENTKER